ncbi:HK97 family phage prohead protease [Labrys sp. 22185]|uniref:HK97 family phage prohead protease n=1 Tax=Labrys sp. 22185 TaxID=3453888 RepID=UPI003F858CDB
MADHLDLETRFTSVLDDGTIEGVGVAYNVVDSYRSEFAPEAFNPKGKLPMLWAHDSTLPIGSWSRFEQRADGLHVTGKLNLAVAKALEVRALLQAGDINGMSIGFRTLKDTRLANGVRRILQADLREISIVTFPAVPGSTVSTVRTIGPDLTEFHRALTGAIATLRR